MLLLGDRKGEGEGKKHWCDSDTAIRCLLQLPRPRIEPETGTMIQAAEPHWPELLLILKQVESHSEEQFTCLKTHAIYCYISTFYFEVISNLQKVAKNSRILLTQMHQLLPLAHLL